MAPEYRMLIGGKWVAGRATREVKNKYDGSVLGTIPLAQRADVETAIFEAEKAFPAMADMPAHRRGQILEQTAALLEARRDEVARVIAAEAGKAMKFARIEVDRGIQTFKFAGEEAKRIHGETVPTDASPAGTTHAGFYLRVPVGVVVAISPFNFPLNLVAHKVAPALAAGNTLVLKPATWTPLTAVKLGEILLEAGCPPGAFNLIFGDGGTVGEWLVTDPRVAKITFTGSASVGEQIVRQAGLKKVTMELGNTSPTIIEADGDLDLAVPKCAVGAFYNSGQVCLSVQRIYVHRSLERTFTERFVRATQALKVGDPLDEQVDVGPMIDEREAIRAEEWVNEAIRQGARLLCGGKREGAVLHPTVLTDVTKAMKVVCNEVFAPVVSLIPYDDLEEALTMADDTEYGLQAAIFTRDLKKAFRAIKRLNFGGVMVNETSAFRVDHMPYGGNRRSGIGREGVRYAIEEMTNIKMVVFNLA
ncbi:MAG: aldehyde dehydrogenase family protein [Deltaproteobacteria bacterium]|nr:aldehyde dehydrogenase family protein [Deltaproteobacteria bacterium]